MVEVWSPLYCRLWNVLWCMRALLLDFCKHSPCHFIIYMYPNDSAFFVLSLSVLGIPGLDHSKVFSYLTQSCLLAFFLSAFLSFTFLYSLEPHPDFLCQPSLVSFPQSPVTFSVLLADIGLNFYSSSETVRWLLFSTETTQYFLPRSWLVFVRFSEINERAYH